METLTRTTASRAVTRNQVEALSRTVQALWSSTPIGGPEERERLVVQLTQLESDIERLRIRSAIGELRSEDVMRSYADRLAHLERRWSTKDTY